VAICKDENNQLYLGLIYIKDDNNYSGNFLRISKEAFERINFYGNLIRKFMALLIFMDVVLFFYKTMFGKSKNIDFIFLVIGAIICVIGVLYYLLGPIILASRGNKIAIKKLKLICLITPTINFYLSLLALPLALFLDMILSGFLNILSDGFFLLITIGPLILLPGLAIFYYSKYEKNIAA
jgi:hypothetical protein